MNLKNLIHKIITLYTKLFRFFSVIIFISFMYLMNYVSFDKNSVSMFLLNIVILIVSVITVFIMVNIGLFIFSFNRIFTEIIVKLMLIVSSIPSIVFSFVIIIVLQTLFYLLNITTVRYYSDIIIYISLLLVNGVYALPFLFINRKEILNKYYRQIVVLGGDYRYYTTKIVFKTIKMNILLYFLYFNKYYFTNILPLFLVTTLIKIHSTNSLYFFDKFYPFYIVNNMINKKLPITEIFLYLIILFVLNALIGVIKERVRIEK